MATTQDSTKFPIKTLLHSAPDKRTKFIYEAIIISLFVHIIILGALYLANSSVPPDDSAQEEENVMDELELSFEEPEIELNTPSGPMSNDVKDLLASATSERTSNQVNYSSKSKAEIDAEVLAQLKGLEASEYEGLKNSRGESEIVVPKDKEKSKVENNKSKQQEGDPTSKPSNQSYSGPVSAEFDLKGRSTRKAPKPTYRCKSSGKVIVKIEVNNLGEVTNATIDPKSSADECIREESLTYAKRWVFDYNEKAAKKQPGSITFTFSPQ